MVVCSFCEGLLGWDLTSGGWSLAIVVGGCLSGWMWDFVLSDQLMTSGVTVGFSYGGLISMGVCFSGWVMFIWGIGVGLALVGWSEVRLVLVV